MRIQMEVVRRVHQIQYRPSILFKITELVLEKKAVQFVLRTQNQISTRLRAFYVKVENVCVLR